MGEQGDQWLLAEPSTDLMLLAGDSAVHIRARSSPLQGPGSLSSFPPKTRLGKLLPSLIGQLLEQDIAWKEESDFCIHYEDFVTLEGRGFDAFENIVPWSPFILGLQSSGWLTDERFTYYLQFYLGNRPVHIVRKGCFIRRGSETFRLDEQTFALVNAVEAFNNAPPEGKAGTDAFLQFARIKGLADEVGTELDEYLTRERVIVPSRLGVDLILDEDDRVTFVPKIDGVQDSAMREAFLALDDVDASYTCILEDGERVRVVLTGEQREAMRRMQRVRHVGGAERVEVLRNPLAVFDGVAGTVEADVSVFGPRVRGVGDFPFVTRPYLQRSVTGIFEDAEASESKDSLPFHAGLTCSYVDGHEQRLAFTSREEILSLKSDAENAWRSGVGQMSFRNKSILVDEPFLRSLAELVNRITKRPQKEPQNESPRRFLLIYTNEQTLEYEEDEIIEPCDHNLELPAALLPSATLKNHQCSGIAWLQRNFRLGRHGCLLADDMGLGKTLQTLTFLAWVIENGHLSDGDAPECAPWNPILIIAPVILLENDVWINDMRRFFVGEGAVFQPWLKLHGKTLKSYRVPEIKGKETEIGAPVLDLSVLRDFRVIFTNYETVTNYQHSFARMRDHWTVVVTDEAQEYKTPSTMISHALKSLSPRFRVACTGTPVETRLLDVWNIFDFLQPGKLLGSSTEFSKRFEQTAEEQYGIPSGDQLEDLKRVLHYGAGDAYVLRRNKEDILTDLPPKHEYRLRCNLSEIQRQWHKELVGRAHAGGEDNHPLALIQQLMRLTQHPALVPVYEPIMPDEALANCPKLEALLKALDAIKTKQEKALIFTRSIDMQQLLSAVIQAKFGLAAEIVNGATSRRGGTQGGHKTRQAILQRFRESLGFDVIILSPDVAGIGLTLVEANHIFHYGRWWNPAKELQATDRAYRIGQSKEVHVYYLIGVDPLREFESFDEKLNALIERRRVLAADFLSPMPSEEDLEKELLDSVLGTTTTDNSSSLPFLDEDAVRKLPWHLFEALVALLWEREGNRVILTPKSGDEGVDIIAFEERHFELVQCKHTLWNAPVDANAVAEMIQSFDGYRLRRFKGFTSDLILRPTLVTNGAGTKEALRSAKDRDVRIVGGTELLNMLISHPCTAVDVIRTDERRLKSMRDVQVRLTALLNNRPMH